MTETWLPVTIADRYEVSNLGRVRSWRYWGGIKKRNDGSPECSGRASAPRVLALKTTRSGHLNANLMVGNVVKQIGVHRLVALSFLGPAPVGKPFVCHRDGNPANNEVGNLYWGTPAENAGDTIVHGRTLRGSMNARAKIDESEAREILRRVMAGESQQSVAHDFGICSAHVSRIARGQAWAHICTVPVAEGRA